jgi:hypothetical protein
MATPTELEEIQDLIWRYRDTSDKEERKKLIKVLTYELKLLKSGA